MINLVKDQLVKLLAQSMPQTQVIYGPATAVASPDDRILTVGNIEGDGGLLDSFTGGTEQERYMIELIISVDLPGNDQQACTELAVADYYVAKRVIREYQTGFDLGIAPLGDIQILPTSRFTLQEQADKDGRHCMIKFGAAVTAQIT